MKNGIRIVIITILFVLETICYVAMNNEKYNHKEQIETYYISICTAKNANQIVDENGNIWVADLNFVTNNRYAVMFTDNGTEDITDDLIVKFKLIYE